MKQALCTLGILVLAGGSLSLQASSFMAYGVGRFTGQSGAGAAVAADASAAYMNPAGLAFPDRPQEFSERGDKVKFDSFPGEIRPPGAGENTDRAKIKNSQHDVTIGFKQVLGGLTVTPAGNNAWAQQKADDARARLNASLIEIGAAIDLRAFVKTPWNIPVRAGFLLHLAADGTVAEPASLTESSYHFLRAGANTNMLTSVFSLGIQLWPHRLSFGFGQETKTTVTGTAYVRNVTLSETNPLFVNAAVNVRAEPVPVVALLYRQPLFLNDFYFSVIYRGRVDSVSDLATKIDLPLGFSTEARTVGRILNLPHRLVAATAYRREKFVAVLDLEYQKWSDAALNPAVAPIEHSFTFADILIIRSGLEFPVTWVKTDLRLRAGYGYIPPYTPEQNSWSNYLDNRKHLFSLGGSFMIPPSKYLYLSTRVDLSLQWQYWVKRDGSKSEPVSFPDGSTQPDFTYGGNLFQMQIGFSWKI